MQPCLIEKISICIIQGHLHYSLESCGQTMRKSKKKLGMSKNENSLHTCHFLNKLFYQQIYSSNLQHFFMINRTPDTHLNSLNIKTMDYQKKNWGQVMTKIFTAWQYSIKHDKFWLISNKPWHKQTCLPKGTTIPSETWPACSTIKVSINKGADQTA